MNLVSALWNVSTAEAGLDIPGKRGTLEGIQNHNTVRNIGKYRNTGSKVNQIPTPQLWSVTFTVSIWWRMFVYVNHVCTRTTSDIARKREKTLGEIHSTKISGKFGLKLNGSVQSNRESFEKTGPSFEVDHFFRSDRSEFWLNGSRPLIGTTIEKPRHWIPFQFRHRLCNHLPSYLKS